MDPGLDAYFFPNLGVGQPSNNIDLSVIEIYLGMIISFLTMKNKNSYYKINCFGSTLSHDKPMVFFSRSVVYFCPFWRHRDPEYILKDIKMYAFFSELWKK